MILNLIVFILKPVIYYKNTLHRKHEDIRKGYSLKTFDTRIILEFKITLYALIMTSYIHVKPPRTKSNNCAEQ